MSSKKTSKKLKRDKINKTKKMIHGKVLDIDDRISIRVDMNQYIVQGFGNYHYFSSLEECFKDIFEMKVKIRLIENPQKNIKKIVEIHKEVAKEIKDIFRRVENPTHKGNLG